MNKILIFEVFFDNLLTIYYMILLFDLSIELIDFKLIYDFRSNFYEIFQKMYETRVCLFSKKLFLTYFTNF